MTENILTDEEKSALATMREIVAEKGRGYTYPAEERHHLGRTCQYAVRDARGVGIGPSCIVGHYLSRKGVSAITLGELTGVASGALQRTGLWANSSVRLANALRKAQIVQDSNLSWGMALDEFEAILFGLDPREREVLTAMRDIVAEKGADHVVSCAYCTYGDGAIPIGPECIVGHFLVGEGWSLEALHSREGDNVLAVLGYAAPQCLPAPRWAQALHAAQLTQDNGCPWGVALRRFEVKLGICE